MTSLHRTHVTTFFKQPKEMKFVRQWRSGRRKSTLDKDWRKVRAWVMDRARGLCEARIEGVCQGRAEHVHHLLQRSVGGKDTPDNLLAVCAGCHHHIHTNIAWSESRGFLRRSA